MVIFFENFLKDVMYFEAQAKIARSAARDASVGRRIAEKSCQHILNQRIRNATIKYQQQRARRR